MMRFKDKVVAITGGSRGFGAALARRFAEEGAAISICARDENALEKISNEIKQIGAKVLWKKCDVTNPHEIHAYVDATLNKFEHVDILINNAGAIVFAPVLETTDEIWDFMMEANLNSARRVTQAFLPYMLARSSGKIIFISSNSAKRAYVNDSAYAASKAGVLQFARTLANEVGRKGIDVFTLCPGLVAETDLGEAVVIDHMNDPNRPFKGNRDEFWKWANGQSPKGAWPSVKQIVDVVTFMASDSGSVLHGTAISADHGYTDW
jgi:NAD(P)-dependent dehydrogenase (short-subunit alcohol dehydrogenase family)